MPDKPKAENRCTVCGKSEAEDHLVFQKDIEETGNNLCGECAVEYQAGWRPEHSPIKPDVERFVWEKFRDSGCDSFPEMREKMRKMRESDKNK